MTRIRSPPVPCRNRSCCSSLELPPRRVQVDLVPVGDRLDDRLVEALAAERPRHQRALLEREARVGDEQVGVDLELRAEAGAPRARAVRGVEREDARLELGEPDAVLGTGEVLAEEVVSAVDLVDGHQPAGERRRRLHGLGEALAQVGLHHEPVDDDLDRVLELLVEDDLLLEQALLVVDLHACEPVAAKLLEHVAELALAVADDRGVDGELRPLGEREHLLDDLVEALPRDRPAADGAVRPADPRVEEPQVVVDLRDRARPSSAGCARSSSGRSRSPARARRSSRRRASPSSAGTGARTRRATRRSGAAPRRRSCRRRARTCPSRRARSRRRARSAGARR